MRTYRNLAVVLAAAFLMTGSAHAAKQGRATPGQNMKSAFMRSYGESAPPFGYVSFCAANPGECKGGATKPMRMKLNMKRWRELNRVNKGVNKMIAPATDQELYDQVELWTYPRGGAGDCEDYVLLKRKMLIKRGWPADTLLITVVLDEKNEGHAVLTAITNSGELILDNQKSAIKRWNQTPYQFHKRQSQHHPSVWVSLTPSDFRASVTATRGE